MQDKLQKIVKTWKIKVKPEFRVFLCANCQRPIKKAFQYLLNNKNFKVSVHLCKNCNNFYNFPKTHFDNFKCDNCLRKVFKSWHIWSNEKSKKLEKHLCWKCFNLS